MKQIQAKKKTVNSIVKALAISTFVYALPSNANVQSHKISPSSDADTQTSQSETMNEQDAFPFLNENVTNSSLANAQGSSLTVSPSVFPVATYSFTPTKSHNNGVSNSLYEYFFEASTEVIEVPQWQAQVGLFVVNNQTALFSGTNTLNNEQVVLSSELNLGFRWGTVNFSEQSTIDSYSVLVGYGLADTVEVNLGYSALDIDQRVHESTFSEGTWYAGFSAKF